MLQKKLVLIRGAVLCLLVVIFNLPLNAQMLSMDSCLQLFAADSAALKNINLDKDFTTVLPDYPSRIFIRSFKSKTDLRVSVSINIDNVDTTRKQLLYNFRSNEQYSKLLDELKAGKFEHRESNKQMIEGKPNFKETYRLGEILITLRKEDNEKVEDRKYSLFIRTFGKQ